MKAEAQVVAGIRINIEITVDIMGCSNTNVAIAATVIIDLDGNFSLETESVSIDINGAKDLAARWWILIFLATLAAIVAQMY